LSVCLFEQLLRPRLFHPRDPVRILHGNGFLRSLGRMHGAR
jgi:hypothetical protein